MALSTDSSSIDDRIQGKGSTSEGTHFLPGITSHVLPTPTHGRLRLRQSLTVLAGYAGRYLRDSLLRNTLFIALGSVLSALLGFVFWVVTARFYPAADVGLASAAMSALMLVVSFSSLGFHLGAIRYLPLAEDKGQVINSSLLTVGAASTIIAGIFVAGIPLWSPDLVFLSQSPLLILAFILFAVIISLATLLRHIFIGLRRSEFASLVQAGGSALRIPLILLFVPAGILGLLFSWGIAIVPLFLIGVFFLTRVQPGYRPAPAFRWGVVKNMTRFSLLNYFSEALGNAPVYIAPLIVLAVLGAEHNAYYYIAWSTANVIGLIPASVAQSLFAEGSNKPEMLSTNLSRAARVILPMLAVILGMTYLLGEKVLLVFGHGYSESGFQLLFVLTLALIPHTINEIYLVASMVRFHFKAIVVINLLRAVLIPSGIFWGVNRFGLIGVGWGYFAAVGIISIGTSLMLVRTLRQKGQTS